MLILGEVADLMKLTLMCARPPQVALVATELSVWGFHELVKLLAFSEVVSFSYLRLTTNQLSPYRV